MTSKYGNSTHRNNLTRKSNTDCSGLKKKKFNIQELRGTGVRDAEVPRYYLSSRLPMIPVPTRLLREDKMFILFDWKNHGGTSFGNYRDLKIPQRTGVKFVPTRKMVKVVQTFHRVSRSRNERLSSFDVWTVYVVPELWEWSNVQLRRTDGIVRADGTDGK